MEADSTAQKSKYAKAAERRRKAAERAREQAFGKPFNETLRSKGPAILAHLEAMPVGRVESSKLLEILPALFVDYRWPMGVPYGPRHHGDFLDYLLIRHGLSPADVARMSDGELLNLLIDDIHDAMRARGRKLKEHTPTESEILAKLQAGHKPRAIADECGYSYKLVKKLAGTRNRRRQRAGQ